MNEPNERATKLEAAQSDLKQLMADVSRAMEKAEEAVARITSPVAATAADTESTNTSRSTASATTAAHRAAPKGSFESGAGAVVMQFDRSSLERA